MSPATHPRMGVTEFFKVILGTPTVLFLMAAFMCENFMAMVLFTWMPTFLYEKFHLSLAMAGLTATLYVEPVPFAGFFDDEVFRSTTAWEQVLRT